MEAIRSNGANYIVRHVKSKGGSNHAMVEQVSQKVIVPCHTRLDVKGAWAPGDVVEVFDNNSWKIATISEVLGKMHVLVRLLGSSQEFKVRKTNIRVRQAWEDDDGARVMVGKGNQNSNGGKLHVNQILNHNQNSTSQVQKTNSRTTLWKRDDGFAVRNKRIQDGYNVGILKRSTDCSSGAFYGASHKVRLIEKDGRYVKVVAANPTKLPELQTWWAFETGCQGISSDNSSEMPCDVSAAVTEQIACHFPDDRSPHHSGYEGHCLPTKEELSAEIHRVVKIKTGVVFFSMPSDGECQGGYTLNLSAVLYIQLGTRNQLHSHHTTDNKYLASYVKLDLRKKGVDGDEPYKKGHSIYRAHQILCYWLISNSSSLAFPCDLAPSVTQTLAHTEKERGVTFQHLLTF
ncbi:hypothetical protein SDJN03_16475, partial [Cucurbita argyrosperma subsp. sororia]